MTNMSRLRTINTVLNVERENREGILYILKGLYQNDAAFFIGRKVFMDIRNHMNLKN